jgi:hypothetical protein
MYFETHINVFPLSFSCLQESVQHKLFLPEKGGPIACSADGMYLAMGTATGKIYFWRVSLQIWKAANRMQSTRKTKQNTSLVAQLN